MKKLVPLLALSVLPGCFLKQQEPKPTAKHVSSPVSSIIALEDVHGAKQGATAMALFAVEGKPAVSRYVAFTNEYRGTECRVGKKAQVPSAPDRAAPRGLMLVDAGRVSVGPAGQSTFLTIPQRTDKSYATALTAGFPAGQYQINVEGAGAVPQFAEKFSVPEHLLRVTGNTARFEDANIVIKRSEPFRVQWDAPTMPNDANQLVLQIKAQTQSEIVQLECGVAESQLLGNAGQQVTWEIPASALSVLPVTDFVEIWLMRANVRAAANAQIKVQFQGIRTAYTGASIPE